MKSNSDVRYNAENINKLLESVFFDTKTNIDDLLSKLNYIDICYYVLKFLNEKLTCPKEFSNDFYEKVFNIGMNVLDNESERKYFLKENKKNKKMKISNVFNMLEQMWLKFLKSPMPESLRLDVMIALGDEVMDNVDDSSIFSDIIIKSFEKSRESGIVTLRGLFKLLLNNKINYTPIYDILYDLLQQDIFQSPFCSRFFDDISVILSSKSMSHAVAVKFAKRLAELTQFTGSNHCLSMLVRLVVNLMKWHCGATSLIHRNSREVGNEDESMLLDIKALQNHFDSEVRNLAMEINSKLNNRIDHLTPSQSIEKAEIKTNKSRERIQKAIDALMGNNCSLPELEPISNIGNVSMKLF